MSKSGNENMYVMAVGWMPARGVGRMDFKN